MKEAMFFKNLTIQRYSVIFAGIVALLKMVKRAFAGLEKTVTAHSIRLFTGSLSRKYRPNRKETVFPFPSGVNGIFHCYHGLQLPLHELPKP